MTYTVKLDGILKGKGLSFADAVRLATDLAKGFGWQNFYTRVQIEAVAK